MIRSQPFEGDDDVIKKAVRRVRSGDGPRHVRPWGSPSRPRRRPHRSRSTTARRSPHLRQPHARPRRRDAQGRQHLLHGRRAARRIPLRPGQHVLLHRPGELDLPERHPQRRVRPRPLPVEHRAAQGHLQRQHRQVRPVGPQGERRRLRRRRSGRGRLRHRRRRLRLPGLLPARRLRLPRHDPVRRLRRHRLPHLRRRRQLRPQRLPPHRRLPRHRRARPRLRRLPPRGPGRVPAQRGLLPRHLRRDRLERQPDPVRHHHELPRGRLVGLDQRRQLHHVRLAADLRHHRLRHRRHQLPLHGRPLGTPMGRQTHGQRVRLAPHQPSRATRACR